MSDRLRILVCGPGLIGRKHAQLIMQSDHCELAALVGPDGGDNLSFASDCGVPLYDRLDEAVSNARVDAVILSSPNAFHHEQALFCIRNKIPVLVEKPLTDDIKHAAMLVDEAIKRDVPVLVGHHRAHSPLLETACEFLSSPAFGRMVCVQASALFYKPAHYFIDGPWRALKGGGPLLINMIHEVGLLRYFCGEISAVFAAAGSHIRGFEVEDTVAITIEFSSGVLGNFLLSDTVASSKSWEMTSGENSAYPFFPDEYCYHFGGTRGSLDFPSMHVRTYDADTDPSWWRAFETDRLLTKRADPLARQLDHFVDVARGVVTPKVSALDGYKNMLIVQAISDSISKRARISI